MVYIGWQNGIQVVAENQIGIGVRYTNLTEALAGNSIKRFEKFGGTEAQRQSVISRINAKLGKAYDLVVFNCEHFAREVSTGKIESKQVRTASTLAITAGAAMLAHKSDAVKVFGGISIFAGLVGHLSQS